MSNASSACCRATRARGEPHVPTIEHVFFIPGVLLIGIAIGFALGARSARAEMERKRKLQRK